jgi:hypothetical protein
MTADLLGVPEEERSSCIEKGRSKSWAHDEIIQALKGVVGNKCWYSEVSLDGHDPEVDHFRPKGKIREIDHTTFVHGSDCEGYWWLAFECENFRLAATHANQRRVFEDSNGGKANYFPVRGDRASAGTKCRDLHAEHAIPLDPCDAEDVRLLSFDFDGVASPAKPKGKELTDEERERVVFSIWLYHLNEREIREARGERLRQIATELELANDDYELWVSDKENNRRARDAFMRRVDVLLFERNPDRVFAGAVDRIIRMSTVDYPWIPEYVL